MKTKTKTITLRFHLSLTTAIRQGSMLGEDTLQLTAAQLRAMGAGRREELARALEPKESERASFGAPQWLRDGECNVEHTEPAITCASLETLCQCLDARLASRSAHRDALKAKQALARAQQAITERDAMMAGADHAVYSTYTMTGDWRLRIADANEYSSEDYRRFVEAARVEAQLRSDRDKAQAKAAADARDARERAERTERECARAAAERWIRDMLIRIDGETYGSSMMLSRYDAGCLPDDTLNGLIRDAIMAPLNYTRYRPLSSADLPAATSHSHPHEVVYSTSRGSAPCTAAEWRVFKRIEERVMTECLELLTAAGGSDLRVEMVEHTARCTVDQDSPEECKAKARSLAVSVNFLLWVKGEQRRFSREYALIG